MLNLNVIGAEMHASNTYFRSVSPGPLMLPIAKYQTAVKVAKAGLVALGAFKTLRSGASAAHVTGDVIGGRIIKKAVKPVKNKIAATHIMVSNQERDMNLFHKKNGMAGRTWINHPGQYQMVIVFHDANRAGPHIDIHIGQLSMVMRVKPDLYSQLKYNSNGYLTENSRKLIIDHVKSEINNASRVPQNLDHTPSNARSTWVGHDATGRSYGDGRTRQVVLESTVDVYKTAPGHPIEMYAPALNPHRSQYIYEVYSGENKTAPILIWGNKTAGPPRLDDRLHLKLIHPEEIDSLYDERADASTSTLKYDGSSCYFVITKDGTTVWSPRTSVKTGEQIEYTFKLDGIANTRNSETIVGMGEVLFAYKTPWYNFWSEKEYLPCATGSGILNSNLVLPENVTPEIKIYRIDRVGRTRVGDLDFWTNRQLQESTAQLNPDRFAVVQLATPAQALAAGYEGVVVVPHGGSVNDGYKVKFWADANDWRIDKVGFGWGEKGGMSGVVACTSLESGKHFNLGPGAFGGHEITKDMMENPSKYEGSVIKVQGKTGHEGRAATVIGFHDDKGLAPV